MGTGFWRNPIPEFDQTGPLSGPVKGAGMAHGGIGLFLFGVFFLGSILKGVGALVAAIGVGQILAGYFYPNTSEEINKAVDEFEKR